MPSFKAIPRACISALPPETLYHIFRLVLVEDPCMNSRRVEQLARVCSSWRQVATGLPSPWAHINLHPADSSNNALTTRIETYASRSGQLPLYIHFHGSEPPKFNPSNRPATFVAPVATRIGTLDLDLNHCLAKFHENILKDCFNGCQPGVFTKVIVRRGCSEDEACKFILPKGEFHVARHEAIVHLDILKQRFENILLNCTALHLDGVFFPWESNAYQGLVELRLTCPGQRVAVPLSQFVAMLRSSPQLRILDFRLYLEIDGPTIIPPKPVALSNLEKLIAGTEHDRTLLFFLPLFGSSPNLLEVSLIFPDDTAILYPLSGFSARVCTNFFSRSNAARVAGSRLRSYIEAANLLNFVPNVQEFALNNCHNWVRFDQYIWEEHLVLAARLDVLYVVDSSMGGTDLLRLVRALKAQKLVCWKYPPLSPDALLGPSGEDLYKELLELCPVVKLLGGNEPNPIGSWL
ncbi:hypothetical protein RSAG8_05584, partial [Rhizoctonia solani AG-8 WAC10335]